MKEQMKIVIVGHVDHGKSTLIGRLLYDTNSLPPERIEELKRTCEALGRDLEFAFVLDHLEEEREQNITIDTTQTFFKTDYREYVIIDAPGHKEFVKNMITGASQADAAILIVDANEGVMEQTRRHSYILSMLGLKKVIVVINKMDLVGYDKNKFENVKTDVLGFLDSVGIQPSYVIPICAKDGFNVAKRTEKTDWYNGLTILEALDKFQTKTNLDDKSLVFPIQDVYKIGDKRILVGRVENGSIKKGQEITFYPSKKETVIKSIEKYGQDPIEALSGDSIGVTLKDPLFIERGEVCFSKESNPIVTNRFKANLFWLSTQDFKKDKIMLKCATQEVECNIKINKRIDSSTLEVIEESSSILKNNEVGEVEIETKRPIVIENFNNVQELGRFVLERGYDTCAGGIITAGVSE